VADCCTLGVSDLAGAASPSSYFSSICKSGSTLVSGITFSSTSPFSVFSSILASGSSICVISSNFISGLSYSVEFIVSSTALLSSFSSYTFPGTSSPEVTFSSAPSVSKTDSFVLRTTS
jgi:hypothetical protein